MIQKRKNPPRAAKNKNKRAHRRNTQQVANRKIPRAPARARAPAAATQLTQTQDLQMAKGYLYPIYGSHPIARTVEYNTVGPTNLHGYLPRVNTQRIFLPARTLVPGPAPNFKVNSTVLTCYDDRFLILHYLDGRANSPVNESLRTATRISWKGEIAIIPLGIRVPFLSTNIGRARLNRAVSLFMAQYAAAGTRGWPSQAQILSML